ncbi:hypothetical protein RAX51_000290 [Vibrio fluvialis]|nr:hypothetical protein [Vibrio fluvialis]
MNEYSVVHTEGELEKSIDENKKISLLQIKNLLKNIRTVGHESKAVLTIAVASSV